MAKRAPIVKLLLDAQVMLLRRGWMGPLNNALLLLTTIGRKSGQAFTTPIGFARDGDDLLAFNLGGTPNWYRNLLVNPEVTLELQRETMRAQATPITATAELLRVIDCYKQQRPENFSRFFKVPADTPTPEVIQQIAGRIFFVRFRPAVRAARP